MSSENMTFDKSSYSNIRGIKGPFKPDPNISISLLTFSDSIWILNRPFIDEPNVETEYGVMEFHDVRVFRVRAFTNGCMLESNDCSDETDWWAYEIDDSEYLRESIEKDQQRTPEALTSHHHYVVYDGWDRLIEIVAREVVITCIKQNAIINIEKLFENETTPILDSL